ncbi:uncharacterized protein [Porites lutea]|uniref:uncharacterized protein isoform X2 n=1 Tax=Porites lutea TaxID=51062 RepID=UPI003CC6C942
MESQKRQRSDDNDNDTSVSKKFPRIATPIRSETKEAVKRLLSERKKKAERVEIKKFDEIQILEELKKRIAKIDENLHGEVEIISGHSSSAVLCVFPSKEKSFNDTIGSFQPVRYLFTPSGHYKFQVFIHRTIAEGKIDIESFAELSALLDKLRKTSGYQMCPGIKDFDEILEDVRMQPATVKEEVWPWRHVGAKSCKLWHKPRDCFVQRDEAEGELDGVCSDCKKVRRKLKILQAKRKDLVDSAKARRQDASSKVKICHLSPASQQARELNVRRERKNYRREAERLRTSTALTVSEEQSKELAKLIDCISSSEEGQEAVKAVCNEADEQQPGSGALLKELWELEREAFFKDQRGNATGKTGNRWSPATIRVALAIYSRSPAAFRAVRSLGILQLPCSKEIRRIIGKNADGPGINEVYLQKQSNLFKQFCKETMNAGKREPLGVGALIWDETKLQSKIVWNSMSSKITGYAMSPEEIPWLHDVFATVQDDFDERKTSYILQFLWRDLTSSFDVIGPYFTCAGSWDHQFLLECVFRTLQVFTLYNFKVRVFVCDGASANLALIKLLCGYKREQLPLCDGEDPFAVTASFQNPYEDQPRDKRVFIVVCPSHQLKNTIAALYSSRPGGTKLFTKDGVEFGWQPIIDQYERDQERAQQNLARRVPGLKYNFVHRDNWTRLNVLPAKIMQTWDLMRIMVYGFTQFCTWFVERHPEHFIAPVTSGMLQGNAIHDVLFDGGPINLDVEDAVEYCGDDLHISSYEESIGYDLRSGDLSPLVATLEDRASLRKDQTAVLINNDMTVAVLLWETGECAIIDSHAHGNYGAVISCVPPGQINTIVSWLAKMVLKYFNRVLGLCTLTFVSYDCT